ncbi:MAG TPA: adenylate kinase [Candidatus Acidoferrales bacterium]|nr:adenylate kinase [Candidatus Acidoferrales bacterium]
MDVVFLGPPGAGKGTQAQILEKAYGLRQLSTGDMLRKNRMEGTELGKLAQSYMDRGDLVPDDIIIAVVEKELEHLPGALFDGFPRTVPQAEALDKLLHRKNRPYTVILFDVEERTIRERLIGRWVNPKTGRVFHERFSPPPDGKIDADGTALIQREDDKPEAVRHRLDVYHKQTEPLIAYYADPRRGRLVKVDAMKSVEDVSKEIAHALGFQDVATSP